MYINDFYIDFEHFNEDNMDKQIGNKNVISVTTIPYACHLFVHRYSTTDHRTYTNILKIHFSSFPCLLQHATKYQL